MSASTYAVIVRAQYLAFSPACDQFVTSNLKILWEIKGGTEQHSSFKHEICSVEYRALPQEKSQGSAKTWRKKNSVKAKKRRLCEENRNQLKKYSCLDILITYLSKVGTVISHLMHNSLNAIRHLMQTPFTRKNKKCKECLWIFTSWIQYYFDHIFYC